MASRVDTTTVSLSEIAARSLVERVRGEVIRPGDATYDQARRVWNAAIDRRPALIVRPRGADDVVEAVTFARANDLPLAVRSGGHSVAGHGTVEGGLVIDLSSLKHLEIDPERRIAWADPGLTWGEYNARTHDYGLATPGPDVANVGLGGLTLGGGFGLLTRKYGMTIDNLLAAEVVTADGERVTATADENSDLFWALRGGGGNVGIATRLRFRLHPVDTVVGGAIVYPATRDVLRDYAAVVLAAPDELAAFAVALKSPPLPFIPAAAHGTPIVMVVACDAGDPASSQPAALASLRALGGSAPLADTVAPLPYPALLDLAEMTAVRRPQAIRAGFLHELDDGTIESILQFIDQATSPFGSAMLRVLGGEMARVPADETAFSHRDKALYMAIGNAWDETDPRPDRHVAWTEALWQAVAPRVVGAYVNYLGDEGEERVRAAYAAESFARLASIKRRYDPENVFRLNANVKPA